MVMRKAPVWVLAAAALGGCGAIVDLIDPPPPKLPIRERTVAVLPFTGYQVLRRFPDLEREIAAAVTAQLQDVYPNTKFIDAETVHDWKMRNEEWKGMPAPDIGRALKAGLIVEINVVDFRTRERADSVLLQGAITAEALVTDVETQRILRRLGRTTVRWPPTSTHTTYDTSDDAVKAKTIARFAEQFTGAFYEWFKS